MPDSVADSLKLIPIKQPFLPQKKDVEEAITWLSGRNITPKKFNSDTFINTTLINKK